ncbi:MAG: PQQ-binding-like beta-propeller repeat protein [Acidobacteriota bacterium]
MVHKVFFAFSISLLLLASGQPSRAMGAADNWPQWRGPELNGISHESGLPASWDTEQNVAWKLAMPAWSGSTPIIWENSIFLNVADGTNLNLWRVDRGDGKVLWERLLSAGDHRERKQNMSSPSPVTDGEHVWVMTGTGILKGFDFDGNEIWSRDIQADYGRFGLNWGYASSPLLYADALFVQVLHGMKTDDPSYLMRIDKLTGKTVWRVERPTNARRESPDAYTTPGLLKYDGNVEIVISGGDVVTGHDADTGRELWRAEGLNPQNRGNNRIVASPVIMDGIVYASSRVRPILALKVGGSGDDKSTQLLWSFNYGSDVPTPVTDGKYFYVVNDRGIMFCLDAKTGETIYEKQRLVPGTYSSSPVLADGRIYATNEDGVTTVVKAGPEFEILAENNLNDYCLSSPAISQGQIFIRTAGFLYAIGQRRRGHSMGTMSTGTSTRCRSASAVVP